MTLLVVAAFLLSVIAIVVSFTWRWRALVPGNLGNQHVVRPDAEMNGPQAFEAAEAASKEARRARLARQERLRKVLTPVAFGLSGLPLIFALVALVFAGDHEAAMVCAMMGTIGLGFTAASYYSAKLARQKAVSSTLQAHQSL